ncbi:MAG TPA: hypothetical protein VFP58_04470 [Candidatus Eisenbacteria bacterium]|nr:hypothetical protein [Candidatus Eisenbacteria bacterium]
MRRLPPPNTRALYGALILSALLAGCSDSDAKPNTPAPQPRTYRMGFSGIPPRPDLAQAIAAIQMWTPRADQALILNEPPWDSLLAGVPAETLLRRDQLQLAQYYRAQGLRIVVSIDPTNGLNRASDSEPLVEAGRSLAEPAIQQLYRDYVVAADTLLRPDAISVASETNLVRLAATPDLYQALVRNAADAAAAIRAVDANVTIFTTVQVETAWGRLGGMGDYEGIAQDRADFPFIQMLGLSSYPYLAGFAEPESLPVTYYERLVESAPIPLMVIEGGWTSASLDSSLISSPEKQRRYLVRHAEILDRAQAVGVFQLTFTDLDPTFFPPGTILPFFAHLGLVDADLNPKPALAAWDAVFARPLHETAPAAAPRPRPRDRASRP